MDYESLIEQYDKLRTKCYRLARQNDGELMGDYDWLRFALSETDMRLVTAGDCINCQGFAYTQQTMDAEWFSFDIPIELIEEA